MQLSLQFSPEWIVKVAPDGQRVAVLPAAAPGPRALPQAIITYGPIVLKPDEPVEWQQRTASDDIPPGARVRLGRTIDHATASGWPLRLVEATVLRGDGDRDEVIEVRLCAFYTFLEHTAVAIARAGDPAAFEAIGPTLLAILAAGQPDWSGAATWVSALWDLPDASTRANRRHRTPAELAEAAAALDARLAAGPTAALHVARGQLLLEQRDPTGALAAFAAALALDDSLEIAHYLSAVAHGDLGQHDAAIAAWTRAAALSPRADTHYNLGQAQFFLQQHEAALASFRAARALAPRDFLAVRKEIQCLYALGRFDEAQSAQIKFREQWESTTDPRARFIDEYVFDQFPADGFTVHAVEILRRPRGTTYTLMTFQAFATHGHHDHALPATVTVETSEAAQSAGTPYVIGLRTGERYQVIGASASLPAYPQMKQEVTRVLTAALAQAAH